MGNAFICKNLVLSKCTEKTGDSKNYRHFVTLLAETGCGWGIDVVTEK